MSVLSPKRKPVVSIDGPAGAGKSTVARLLAAELGLTYVDTGAMYRALAWKALQEGAVLEDPAALLEILEDIELEVRPGKGKKGRPRVFINGEEVTSHLRDPRVDAVVSLVAQHAPVRRELVQRQRQMAQNGGVVMDGRDIGTVVLPDADLKLFLTASLEERARRRGGQGGSGEKQAAGSAEWEQSIETRDRQDSARAEGPLRPAPDAVVLDTTGMSPRAVVAEAVRLCRERGKPL